MGSRMGDLGSYGYKRDGVGVGIRDDSEISGLGVCGVPFPKTGSTGRKLGQRMATVELSSELPGLRLGQISSSQTWTVGH